MKIYALPYPLSRWRERAGVRVDMISGIFPSLSLGDIPYSLIDAKRPALLCIKI
jgi:hypothetical protein